MFAYEAIAISCHSMSYFNLGALLLLIKESTCFPVKTVQNSFCIYYDNIFVTFFVFFLVLRQVVYWPFVRTLFGGASRSLLPFVCDWSTVGILQWRVIQRETNRSKKCFRLRNTAANTLVICKIAWLRYLQNVNEWPISYFRWILTLRRLKMDKQYYCCVFLIFQARSFKRVCKHIRLVRLAEFG
jgi:hypothetical protein